jgi:hypothetical protein
MSGESDKTMFGRTFRDFKGLGLVRPGVLIFTADKDGDPINLLIGDINEDGGVCNCCSVVDDLDIVIAYKVVWTETQD